MNSGLLFQHLPDTFLLFSSSPLPAGYAGYARSAMYSTAGGREGSSMIDSSIILNQSFTFDDDECVWCCCSLLVQRLHWQFRRSKSYCIRFCGTGILPWLRGHPMDFGRWWTWHFGMPGCLSCAGSCQYVFQMSLACINLVMNVAVFVLRIIQSYSGTHARWCTKCQHPWNLQSEGFVMARRGFAAFCCHVMLKQCEITQVFCYIIIAKLIAQPGEHNPSCQQDKKTEIDWDFLKWHSELCEPTTTYCGFVSIVLDLGYHTPMLPMSVFSTLDVAGVLAQADCGYLVFYEQTGFCHMFRSWFFLNLHAVDLIHLLETVPFQELPAAAPCRWWCSAVGATVTGERKDRRLQWTHSWICWKEMPLEIWSAKVDFEIHLGSSNLAWSRHNPDTN